MSDNAELSASLQITYDQAAAAATGQALKDAKAQSDALTKTNLLAADVERENTAAENAAAEATKRAASAAAAKAAATKGVIDVLKELDRQKSIDNLAAKWAKVAKETKDADAAAKGLQADLEKINATQPELRGASGVFSAASAVEQDVSFGSQLQTAGSKLRALPSVQIPGTTLGTDAVANVMRVVGAGMDKLTGASTAAAAAENAQAAATTVVGTASTEAAPGIFASAAGFTAIVLPMAAIIAVAAAVALAVKGAVDDIQNRLAALETQLNARRSAFELAGEGTTTEEARKKLEEYNQTIATQTKILEDNKAHISESSAALVEQSNQFGIINAGVKTGLNTQDVSKYQAQVDQSNATIAEATAKAAELQTALEQDAFAANDAAEKIKLDAEARTKATLESAAAAGQEVAARNRADKATGEQNEARLAAIVDEKEAIQAQLGVLQSSGDTSEEVTSQIAALNQQLNGLGKESQYITTTALAASKARDAEKKAQKDAEKAVEEAAKKQEQADKKRVDAAQKYGDKLVDIATAAADKAEDRLQDLKDKLGKNELDFGRDIAALSVKSNQDRQEAEIAAQQNEAADLRAHQHDLEAIRDEASLNERNALRKGNYLQAAEIREAANAALEKQNKDFVFAQGEKNIGQDEAAAKDDRELDNARQKRLLALQQQNDDARTAFQEAERDDKTARERQQRDAAIARDRDLRAANELATAKLGIEQQVGNAMLQIAGNTLQGIMALGQNMAPQFNYAGAGNTSTTNNNQRTIGSVNFDQRGIPGGGIGVDQAVLRMLGQLGFVERN